ncbi:ferrochelatase [Paenibacillus radicis (ex Gao et al. 2016)]|uniref:Coproporphyrin III ferrochelatase n=1 Tax=Paenibacillus radicis (ex Gao et al. 2016) TaxID=1737354 RepID=A0A917GSV4_9BACL|nr:ferrochelatase [Paenibacillus radicis (ex Gao et al. 2016)]GGG55577.1 ferrochelatase [Paenibacillus radicis (ex Gao et al. 2016)]
MSEMTANHGKIGVLVMSYGTPQSLEDVEAYYTHIRRGHPPTEEQLADLKGRYEAIVGGVFPLRENTNGQVAGLQDKLEQLAPGRYVCYQGLKHASPYIEDGVKQMAEDGVKQAVGIVLAPHFSTMSVGSYIKRAQEQAEASGIAMSFVESYHLHPKLLQALTERVADGLNRLETSSGGVKPVKVLFSAHSLPERIREIGDPYEKQLLETSAAVASKVGIADGDWQFTWQSAGRTREPWLGPDILETLDGLAKEDGIKAVLVAPVGFVSDHLEVLFDLDIEAKAAAGELGVALERIAMLNRDPLYMETLAESVIEAGA